MNIVGAPSDKADRRPFVIMAVIAVLLTIWQHRAWRSDLTSLPERVAHYSVAPPQRALSVVFRWAHDVGRAVVAASTLVEENRRLRDERDELDRRLILTAEMRLLNKALLEKLEIDLDAPLEKLPAWVISRSSGRESRWVKIRAAGSKPLEVGNVVREAKGLVGRVVEVSGSVGRVALIVDPRHAVRGKVPSGDEGMIHAASEVEAGINRLRLEKARRGAEIAVGDVVVTSSVGETYPGGIPIGVVEVVRRSRASTSNLTAYVRPFVDFERLDHVYVLRAGEQ